jgi:autotransporter-associated beta strand protein
MRSAARMSNAATTAGMLAITVALACMPARADLLAGWDFQTTSNGGTALQASPATPRVYNANFGSGTLYLDGSNGSSNWFVPQVGSTNTELNGFGGTITNTAGTDLSTTTASPAALALIGGASTAPGVYSANGKFAVFTFSMTGYQDLVVSYASQRTNSGFTSQNWEYSDNGVAWRSAQVVTSIASSFSSGSGLITLNTVTGLNNVAVAYLRLSGTGATLSTGNNRFDNIQFNAIAMPKTISVSIASGSQSQAQAGYTTLSGSLPLIKSGNGTLVLDQANTLSGSTVVQGGTLQLAHSSALASSLLVVPTGGTVTLLPNLRTTVSGLSADVGGLIDAGTGLITVASGLSTTQLDACLRAGRGDGSWNGTSGITSSVAAASGGLRTVGWLNNDDGSVTFGFVAAGDTNLDWQVDILDVADILSRRKFNTGRLATWAEGDFNYDGVLDIQDIADFSATGLYGMGTYTSQLGIVAAVPEPSPCLMGLTGFVLGCIHLALRCRV